MRRVERPKIRGKGASKAKRLQPRTERIVVFRCPDTPHARRVGEARSAWQIALPPSRHICRHTTSTRAHKIVFATTKVAISLGLKMRSGTAETHVF